MLGKPNKKTHYFSKWNETQSDYPSDKTIHTLFEEQVVRTPNNIAVEYQDRYLTYESLNQKANQLAHHLRSYHLKPGSLIAILMNPSIDRIIATLAILKSGCAYLPLEPTLPKQRIDFMLSNARISVILTESKLQKIVQATENVKTGIPTDVISLDREWLKFELLSTENIDIPPSMGGKDLAYVIYTSGTTGVPKGVCVLHQGISRLVINTNYIYITQQDCIAQTTNFAFDVATFEMWGALLHGAKLAIIDKETLLNPHEFEKTIQIHHITIVALTTQIFHTLCSIDPNIFANLKYLLIAGEVANPRIVEKLVSHEFKPTYFLNVYGPTENTTYSTAYLIENVNKHARSIPIGKPISNTQCYILDNELQPVPIGKIGELYLGGEGLAIGYLNQSKLTDEKFIANPFSNDPHDKLYKTGDLARWLADGNIDYIGRIDNQVKIRGFRVELDEITAHLWQYPGIEQATVIIYENEENDKQLVAYLVFKDKKSTLTTKELQDFLNQFLPSYMIPNIYIVLDKIPVNHNGKINKSKLPKPDISISLPLLTNFEEPKTTTEKSLAQLWNKILGINKISVCDDFFKLGGHSLLIIKVISGIKKEFHVDVTLTDFHNNISIRALAQLIDAKKNKCNGSA